ncbi:MAG TPA: FecR domain-containing protein [Burkholderiaceae bacterium]|nr:FecR domain-containing protein [Burkholderiaceae bacterium]
MNAQPEVPRAHSVRPGDTLYGLSKKYLKDPALWPLIARSNPALVPRRLLPGQTVHLPGPSGPALVAVVLHVNGQVLLTPPDSAPVPLVKGRALAQGDALQVPHGGHATLLLEDGSVVHVREDTVLALEPLRTRDVRSAQKSSVGIYLTQGRIDSDVKPRAKGSRFEVRTPLAAAGVRGTQFGVSFDPKQAGMAVDVTQGSVLVTAASSKNSALLAALQGTHLAPGQTALARDALLAAPDLSTMPATTDGGPTTIAFERVPRAAAYQAVLARDAALQEVVEIQTHTEPSLRVMALETGDYYLSVRAVDRNGLHGAPARTRVAVQALPPPAPPYLRSPQRAEKVRTSPSLGLTCTEVRIAAAYKFQLGRDAEFRTLLLDEQVPGQCALRMAKPLAPGVYYWRVASIARRIDGREVQGPFGETGSFEIVMEPAERNLVVASEAGRVSLRWAGSPGLTYHMQVSRSPAFETVSQDLRLNAPQVELRGLAPGDYFVRLKAIDASGLESGFSTTRSFRLDSYLHSSDGQPVRDTSGSGVEMPP